MQQSSFKDARYFQILFQFVLLLYGFFYLHWNNDWWLFLTYVSAGITTQLLIEYFTHKKYDSWKSALITSFGLCLLLKTNSWEVAVMAAVISIASKYLIRINGKHIFNPSAFGIVTTILISQKAWISPGQWGSGMVLFFDVICLGCIVVSKVQKLDVSISFLATFTLLLFIRQVIYLGWPLDFFVQSISTGSLLLFSFFMVTDPKTTPDHAGARIVWCMLVAIFSFYLSAFKFINAAPIWVLVFASPLVPILDVLFKAKRFEWKPRLVKS